MISQHSSNHCCWFEKATHNSLNFNSHLSWHHPSHTCIMAVLRQCLSLEGRESPSYTHTTLTHTLTWGLVTICGKTEVMRGLVVQEIYCRLCQLGEYFSNYLWSRIGLFLVSNLLWTDIFVRYGACEILKHSYRIWKKTQTSLRFFNNLIQQLALGF